MKRLLSSSLKRRNRRSATKRRNRLKRSIQIESLEDRRVLAVTAALTGGILTIIGDADDNQIEISQSPEGEILVNNGAVEIAGGTATPENTSVILALGLEGNDEIRADNTSEDLPRTIVVGGEGNDVLVGGSGDDFLLGGSGDDFIRGGDGEDQLVGGIGNDTLVGDRGNDRVLGQSGDDLLVWNNGDGSDLMEGGEGRDTVQVNGADAAGDDFSIDSNGDRVRFQRNNLGLFQLDIGTTENLDVNGQGGDDYVQINDMSGVQSLSGIDVDGGDGNDRLDARNLNADVDFIGRGGDGRDVIFGGMGNDTLLGEGGNDFVRGFAGDDLIDGGDGRDVIFGDLGNDDLRGGAQNDVIFGGEGDDVLDGGDGFDFLVGGSGADMGVNGEFNIGVN